MAKLSLSYRAMSLLKYVVSYTGEKEVNDKGVEADSPRRLNGEEASQRRHFTKLIAPIQEEVEKKVKEVGDEHNNGILAKKKEELKAVNPKMKFTVHETVDGQEVEKEQEETEEVYDRRISLLIANDQEIKDSLKKANEAVETLLNSKHDLELTEKTFEVMKKYFKEFGEKAGYLAGDDEAVEELEEQLK